MRTIERIPLVHGKTIDLPAHPDSYEVRHVAEAFGTASVWVELDVSTPVVPHAVRRYETGDTVPDKDASRVRFLGSLMERGGMVWHYYASRVA